MIVGFAGIDRRGIELALRLQDKGHDIVVCDDQESTKRILVGHQSEMVGSLSEMLRNLPRPRTIWTAFRGEAMDSFVEYGSINFSHGDTVISAGNEFYRNSRRHSVELAKYGIKFLDVGFSGDLKSIRDGANIMIGGDPETYEQHQELLGDLSAPLSAQFFPGTGAGHFVSMVHHSIEFEVMSAYARAFDVLRSSESLSIELTDAARIFNRNSVVSSRLMNMLEESFRTHGNSLEHLYERSLFEDDGVHYYDDIDALIDMPTTAIATSAAAKDYRKKTPSFQVRVVDSLRKMLRRN